MLKKWEEGRSVTRSVVIPGVGRVLLDDKASGEVGVGNSTASVHVDVYYHNGVYSYTAYAEGGVQ